METMDSQRQTAIDTLTECYSYGYLDNEELERRVEEVYAARGLGDLKQLIEDLPDLYRTALVEPGASGDSASGQQITSILSERKMSGAWLSQRMVKCTCVASEVRLDFCEAGLPPGRTRIHLFGALAEVTVVVPPDVKLILDVNPVLAEVSTKKLGGDASGETTRELQITGTIVLGELSCKTGEKRETKKVRAPL